MHYGKLGMHWGKRTGGSSTSPQRVRTKDLQKSATRQAFDNAKTKKKDAYDDYADAYDNYARNPLNAFTKRGDQKFNTMNQKLKKSNRADADFKAIKTDRKLKIKSKTRELNAATTTKEKMIYNSANRKRAAKYIVDNDMPVSEATKRAKGDARRNTAILVAAYAPILVASLYVKNK